MRVAALFGLALAFVGGTLAIAHRLNVAQVPSPPAISEPDAAAAPSPEPTPAPSAPKAAEPAPHAAPQQAAAPAVAPADTPAQSVVSAAPAATASPSAAPAAKPVQSAPPAAAPAPTDAPAVVANPPAAVTPAAPVAPAVTIAPLPPEKPAIPTSKEAAIPARTLFASEKLPSLGKAMSIGYYPRGCLQGGVELPVNGPTWQVMRLSRNRNWGHPELVNFLERFAPLAAKATGWHGILVGDMAQPRGGPLPFGHVSHQIGLDVDIWFMPMPDHTLNKDEREKTAATNLVADDWKHINSKTWTPQYIDFIKTAAEQPEVERVLVNAAIKKELCRVEAKNHSPWLAKVRPWYGHNDHIHVRLKCPADSPNCRKQPPVPGDDGCNKSLDAWFADKILHPQKKPGGAKPRPLMLADLPPACKTVLDAPAKNVNTGAAELR
jgi:penicillin-insensitive murein endopeptidase